MNEFELIAKYFTRPARHAVLGVGDDCALLAPRAGYELAVTTDMLVAGRHFPVDADPGQLGHKALAVNLSDIAAMGATPRWALLAGALPEVNEDWLARFSAGLFALADRFDVDLVGGDTTRGPLNLCLTIIGEVPAGRALRRSGARAGDDVWVSGTLGNAALALAQWRGEVELTPEESIQAAAVLHSPQPRLALGWRLLDVANSAIDISDGLTGDLGHILERSRVGATIELAALPRSAAIDARLGAARREFVLQCLLAGGDDYELCFTASVSRRESMAEIASELDLPLARIGSIDAAPGLRIRDERGEPLQFRGKSFDHFAK